MQLYRYWRISQLVNDKKCLVYSLTAKCPAHYISWSLLLKKHKFKEMLLKKMKFMLLVVKKITLNQYCYGPQNSLMVQAIEAFPTS